MVIENLDISVFRLFYVKAKCNITNYQSIYNLFEECENIYAHKNSFKKT